MMWCAPFAVRKGIVILVQEAPLIGMGRDSELQGVHVAGMEEQVQA